MEHINRRVTFTKTPGGYYTVREFNKGKREAVYVCGCERAFRQMNKLVAEGFALESEAVGKFYEYTK